MTRSLIVPSLLAGLLFPIAAAAAEPDAEQSVAPETAVPGEPATHDAEKTDADHAAVDGHATAGPSYDFVELGWSVLDASHNGNGPAANLSVSLSGHAFLYANASFVDFEHGAGNADAWRAGGGFHTPVSDQWDVLVRGAAQHLSEGGHDSLGVQFEGGLKGKFTPQVEAWAMVGRSNWSGEHFHDQTFARLGVLYEINHHWGVTGDAVLGKHEKEYFLAVSYLF